MLYSVKLPSKVKEKQEFHWQFIGTSASNAGNAGLISGWGDKIQHVLWAKNQNIKQKQYFNKFNTDFKIVHIKKKNPEEIQKDINTGEKLRSIKGKEEHQRKNK